MKINIFKPNKKYFYIISILVLTSVIFLLIISNALAITQYKITKKTDKKIDEVANKLLEKMDSWDKDLQEDKNKIIQEFSAFLKTKIDSKLDSWDKDLKEDKDKIVKVLSKTLRVKMDNLENFLTKEIIPNQLNSMTQTANQKIEEIKTEDIVNNLKAKMDNLENSLTKKLIPKYLEQLTKKAEGKIEAFNIQEITQKILVILDQKLKALADDFAKTLQTAIDNLGQSIEKDKKSLMDNIAVKIDLWDKDLQENKQQIIEEISAALENLKKATKSAKNKMENIEDNIRVKEFVEILKTSINQLPTQLIQTIKDLIKESLPTWLGGTTPDNKKSNTDPNENNPALPAVTLKCSNSSVGKIISLFGPWWNS